MQRPSPLRASKRTSGDRTASSFLRISSGGFPPASVAAGSAAHLLPATPAGSVPDPRRPPSRSAALASCVPNHHLVFESHSIGLAQPLAHVGNQRQHISGGSPPCVHKEIRMPVAHPRVAERVALQAQFVDHPSGRPARRILEDASGAFLPQWLARAPLFVAETNSLQDFLVRPGGKFSLHCEHHII